MKNLLVGLLLTLSLTSWGQTGWVELSPPYAGYSKDTLRMRKLEKENARLRRQIKDAQVGIANLFSIYQQAYNVMVQADLKVDSLIKKEREHSALRASEKATPTNPWFPLMIDSPNEIFQTGRNRFWMDGPTGDTFQNPIDTTQWHDLPGVPLRVPDSAINKGLLWSTITPPSYSITLGTESHNPIDVWSLRADTVDHISEYRCMEEQVRIVSDEAPSTFWHQHNHRPFVAKIQVIFDGWGHEVDYLTRFYKPLPKGFKIWPR